MVLVFGATGTTGGEVARQLIAAGHKPRLLVTDPARAREFAGHAEIATGDLARPDSLAAALRGIERMYLMSPAAADPALETGAIAAAKKVGVMHVVKLSVLDAGDPQEQFARWHAQAEAALRGSSLAWTILRPAHYMSNALGWAATIKTQGAFYEPAGTGRWAAFDPSDLAAIAVKALTEPGHEGKIYSLTGPESLTAADYASQLAAALGKPVRFVDVPPESARDAMLKNGLPLRLVDAILDLAAATRAGAFDRVTTDFERVTGRPPASFAAWARRHASAFR
ncbi:MAG: SDR family oxidoreductase [Terriglobales bacterium]